MARLGIIRVSIVLLPLCGLLSSCLAQDSVSDGPAPVAFVHVSVIPMTGEGILKDRTVLVRNGKIESLQESGKADLPGSTIIIDGSVRVVQDGLIQAGRHTLKISPEGLRPGIYLLHIRLDYLTTTRKLIVI